MENIRTADNGNLNTEYVLGRWLEFLSNNFVYYTYDIEVFKAVP